MGFWSTKKSDAERVNEATDAFASELKEKRNAAKAKNPLRKIKLIDNVYAKKENQEDAEKINEFRGKMQRKVEIERRNREVLDAKIAKSDWKKPAAIAAAVVAVIAIAIIIFSHVVNAAQEERYEKGLELMLQKDYLAAVQQLEGVSVNDGKSLSAFANAMAKVNDYKGRPGAFKDLLSGINGISSPEVNRDLENAISLASEAVGIQDKINAIDLASISPSMEGEIESIEDGIESLGEPFGNLINDDDLVKARTVVDSINEGGSIGLAYLSISEIGEVSLDAQDRVYSARALYDSLNKEEQRMVFNYKTLTSAEAELGKLIEEAKAFVVTDEDIKVTRPSAYGHRSIYVYATLRNDTGETIHWPMVVFSFGKNDSDTSPSWGTGGAEEADVHHATAYADVAPGESFSVKYDFYDIDDDVEAYTISLVGTREYKDSYDVLNKRDFTKEYRVRGQMSKAETAEIIASQIAAQ